MLPPVPHPLDKMLVIQKITELKLRAENLRLRNALLRRRLNPTGAEYTFSGEAIMFIVKADHEDVPYRITPPSVVQDREGNPVPVDTLEYSVESDNAALVSLVPDDDADPLTGVVHFGAPGSTPEESVANINVLISHDGDILGSFGAQFTVVPGDPASIVGGTIEFEGLSEVEPDMEDPLGPDEDEDLDDTDEPV